MTSQATLTILMKLLHFEMMSTNVPKNIDINTTHRDVIYR